MITAHKMRKRSEDGLRIRILQDESLLRIDDISADEPIDDSDSEAVIQPETAALNSDSAEDRPTI